MYYANTHTQYINPMRKNSSFSFVTEIDADVEKIIRQCNDGDMGILALRDNILFPGTVTPVTIGRKKSLTVLKKAEKSGKYVAAFVQKAPETDDPAMDDLYHVGTVCRIVHLMKLPDGNHNALLQAINRVGLDSLEDTHEGMKGHVTAIPEIKSPDKEAELDITVEMIRERIKRLSSMTEDIPMEVIEFIKKMPTGVFFVNFICTSFPFPTEKKAQLICEDTDLGRATLLLKFLNFEIQLAKMRQDVEAKTHADLNRQQREYFVNQEIRNLQAELGNTDEFSSKFDDLNQLRQQARDKKWNGTIAETFEKELTKLSRINAQSPDYNVQLNYLQTMLQLPWGEYTQDNLDLKRAQRFLDEDHYGMEKVKERILEHLAVLKLKADKKSPIICLYGPPGVGKTSLCRSIANALKRNYVRISLGGMHDESEIRGHRRTYIGAMPGRIVKSIIKAGSSNPVFVLDEIDKVTQATVHGDPSSALLEVLDPEQNTAFHDNFLDVDYDLSHVMFIATANDIHTIPRPLLDRMELIEVSGYITEITCECELTTLATTQAGLHKEDFTPHCSPRQSRHHTGILIPLVSVTRELLHTEQLTQVGWLHIGMAIIPLGSIATCQATEDLTDLLIQLAHSRLSGVVFYHRLDGLLVYLDLTLLDAIRLLLLGHEVFAGNFDFLLCDVSAHLDEFHTIE